MDFRALKYSNLATGTTSAPARCLILAWSDPADPRDEESDADRSVLVSNLLGDEERF